MTGQEYAAAVAAVQAELGKIDGTVTSATATVGRGTVHNPNLDGQCVSGRVLHITLFGTFHIGVSPAVGQPAGPVTAILLTADAKTGQACELGVHVGSTSPEPNAVTLHLG